MYDLSLTDRTESASAEGVSLAPSAHLRRRNIVQNIAVNIMRLGTVVTVVITAGIIFSLIAQMAIMVGIIGLINFSLFQLMDQQ